RSHRRGAVDYRQSGAHHVEPARRPARRIASESAQSRVVEGTFVMWKVFALVLITMALASAAGASERRVEGLWLTQGKSGVVEIYRCSESVLCGRLVWFRVEPSDPDPPQVDIHNPTPGLRTRPLCGLTIMWGLQPDGPDRWTDGSLYDPESG